jgi:RNA polymerase primary sigma factor
MTEIHYPPSFVEEPLPEDNFSEAPMTEAVLANSAMEAVLQKARELPLLTAQEEKTLASKIQGGDTQALHELIEHNLRLIPYFMAPFKNHGVEEDDLFMEGYFGLQAAAEQFDLEQGVRFTTYASHKIKRAMQASTENQGQTIRIPKEVHWRKHSINSALKTLGENPGANVALDDISSFTDLSPHQIQEALRAFGMQPISLNATVGESNDEPGSELQELVNPRQHVIGSRQEDVVDIIASSERERILYQALASMDERDRQVLILRYGLLGETPLTNEQAGEAMDGICRARVQQLESRALDRLAGQVSLRDAAYDPDNFESTAVDPEYFSKLVEEWGIKPIEGLSDRANVVAYLLSEGKSNVQMSRKLRVGEGIVKHALKDVYVKVGIGDSKQFSSKDKRAAIQAKLQTHFELEEAA